MNVGCFAREQIGAGEQRGRDERRERFVVGQALLHGLAIRSELVVAVFFHDELAAVDAAVVVDHLEVGLDPVDEPPERTTRRVVGLRRDRRDVDLAVAHAGRGDREVLLQLAPRSRSTSDRRPATSYRMSSCSNLNSNRLPRSERSAKATTSVRVRMIPPGMLLCFLEQRGMCGSSPVIGKSPCQRTPERRLPPRGRREYDFRIRK